MTIYYSQFNNQLQYIDYFYVLLIVLLIFFTLTPYIICNIIN